MSEYLSLKGRTVLVVEDEEILRELIVEEIELAGGTSLEAENGVVALELLQKYDVDFILSDIRMPGGSGIDFLKKVKKTEKLDLLPFMIFSGFPDLTMEEAKELGAYAILKKPFMWSELLPIVARALDRGRK